MSQDALGPQFELHKRRQEKMARDKELWTRTGYDVPPQIETLGVEGMTQIGGIEARRQGKLKQGFNPGHNAPHFVETWDTTPEGEEHDYTRHSHVLSLRSDHPDPRKRMWGGGTREKPPDEPPGVPARFRLRYHGPEGEGNVFPELANRFGHANLIDTEDPDEAMRATVQAMTLINRMHGPPGP